MTGMRLPFLTLPMTAAALLLGATTLAVMPAEAQPGTAVSARSGPRQSASTHASSGPKHDPTSTSRRLPGRPLLSAAPQYQSRSRSRAASNFPPSHRDSAQATQLSVAALPQLRPSWNRTSARSTDSRAL
jgi:hypothetical protein